jgi:hypothetical protein
MVNTKNFCQARSLQLIRIAVLAMICGCSSDRIPTFPVRGRVTFPDGAEVRTGVIELRSLEHGFNARSEIDRNGNFVLGTYENGDGAVAGQHQAIVMQFLATDSGPEMKHDHGDPVDQAYSDYATSPLRFEITDGANDLSVEVERSR